MQFCPWWHVFECSTRSKIVSCTQVLTAAYRFDSNAVYRTLCSQHAERQGQTLHKQSFKGRSVLDRRHSKVCVVTSSCTPVFCHCCVESSPPRVDEILPEATALIDDMPWQCIWARSFSHAWVIHTHHSNVDMGVIRRAMTATAQNWWLAVGNEM